jgi:hypothetical protein
MSKEKGHFKGRVVEISGSKIVIDTKEETREIIDKTTGERKVISSVWKKPDMPKVNQIVRGIFHRED